MDRKYSPCRRVYVLFVLQEKGIISQSVKEVLTSLCDDGLVDTEKVGTSVYFWAFPSKESEESCYPILIKIICQPFGYHFLDGPPYACYMSLISLGCYGNDLIHPDSQQIP